MALAAICAFVLVAVAPGVSLAEEDSCVPHGSAAGLEVDAETIGQFIAESNDAGEDVARIHETLTDEWCLEEIGVQERPAFKARASQHSDLEWRNLSIFYDKNTKYYVASADWTWLNNNFLKDEVTALCINNKIGGHDGVGLLFSGGDMEIIGKSATAWGNPAKNGYSDDYGIATVPYSTVNQSGVGFKTQDLARKLTLQGVCQDHQYDYSMYAGTVTVSFASLEGCKNIQLFSTYAHTWNSTAVNSIGAGGGAFSIGWSSSENHWDKEESGPRARVCER